jgi:hypothetical protein
MAGLSDCLYDEGMRSIYSVPEDARWWKLDHIHVVFIGSHVSDP